MIKEQSRRLRKISEDNEAWFTKRREVQIKHRYNLTLDQFSEILLSQDDSCAICKDPIALARFEYAVDHDHSCCEGRNSCGKCVRGILCQACNKLIAFARDSVETLGHAIKYLEKSAEDVD